MDKSENGFTMTQAIYGYIKDNDGSCIWDFENNQLRYFGKKNIMCTSHDFYL